jgi:hypothetical protein
LQISCVCPIAVSGLHSQFSTLWAIVKKNFVNLLNAQNTIFEDGCDDHSLAFEDCTILQESGGVRDAAWFAKLDYDPGDVCGCLVHRRISLVDCHSQRSIGYGVSHNRYINMNSQKVKRMV